MITFVEVAIGTGGTLACADCAGPDSPSPRGIAEIEGSLNKAAALLDDDRGTGVLLTGFEPFMHPELPRIVAAAAGAGFTRIRLRTDATALTFGVNAEGVVDAGVTQIEVVLLGDAALHDRLAGRQGAFVIAKAGVEAFVEAATRQGAASFVSGYLPLCTHGLEVASAAIAAFAMLGAEAVELDASAVAGEPKARELLSAALDTATVNRVHAWASGMGGFPPPYDRAPWAVVEVPS